MGDIEFSGGYTGFPEIDDPTAESGWDRDRDFLHEDDTPGVDPLANRLVEEGERSVREAQTAQDGEETN